MKHQSVIVLNLGGSKALVVAKRIRECGVYSEVYPYSMEKEELEALAPQGVIVTGAGEDVHADAQEKVPWLTELGCPTLEVGLGTSLSVEALAGGIGKKCLDNFLKITCNCTGDWTMTDWIESTTRQLKETIGDRQVMVGVTGGVDSAVTAALLARAVGKQCKAVLIDNGLLRKGEAEETAKAIKKLPLEFIKVNAETKFMFKLLGIDDPTKKKNIINQEYAAFFDAEAEKWDAQVLAKSTIYTDLLVNHSLPLTWKPKEVVEPLKNLFKDEVVQLAKLLELPDTIVQRQPFPLYGLATRCIGAITMERLNILREADALFVHEVEKEGLTRHANQYFVAITNFKSAAIRGNRQTHEYTLVLRAVQTNDFISSDWTEMSAETLRNISRRLTTEISGVGRVLYDVTATPPAAIEFE